MSENVIDINANKPHWTDRVTCCACGHGWQAVAPVGTDICECPSCHQMSGVRYNSREIGMIRALEQVATGRAPNENSRVNWDIARGIARKALENAGWPLTIRGDADEDMGGRS